MTLLLHDWGKGLGFQYANLNQDNINAIAFMEAMYDYYHPLYAITCSYGIKNDENTWFGVVHGASSQYLC